MLYIFYYNKKGKNYLRRKNAIISLVLDSVPTAWLQGRGRRVGVQVMEAKYNLIADPTQTAAMRKDCAPEENSEGSGKNRSK